MRLIKDWKVIALKAHSMWAFYLGLVALLLPDAIYVLFGIDTNPRMWIWIALALFLYGIVGRIKVQGIADE